jgi:hypothetical protein
MYKIQILNDKYYKNYSIIFNYSINKYSLINKYILFNFIPPKFNYNLDLPFSLNKQTYSDILLDSINYNRKRSQIDYSSVIVNNSYKQNDKILLISSSLSIIYHINLLVHPDKINIILIPNINYDLSDIQNRMITYKEYNSFKFYSSHYIEVYKLFLKNLKINDINDSTIPKHKYNFISNHILDGNIIGFIASYNTTLQMSNFISTIAMSLKLIEKNGTLLLFWSIVNINIPIIQKLISILVHGFKNVEIIDNDINMNLLIGVPEYYIKCSGYKDNISNELINKLIDIAIETVEYTYGICDILDYYEDYTIKNPNHSLFYNRIDNENSIKTTRITYSKKSDSKSTTKSSYKSSKHSTSFNSKWLNDIGKKSSNKTRKNKHKTNVSQSVKSVKNKSIKSIKPIKPIYYIEDINIPELDIIMKDDVTQFKTSLILNKLEGIFVGFFENVNYMITNYIVEDKNGDMIVSEQAMRQKDITNLTKLIKMFEHNKLPYNKHALSVITEKRSDYINTFYSLDNTININLIKYNDKYSKQLNKDGLDNFKLCAPYGLEQLEPFFSKITLAYQVKEKLLDSIGLDRSPKEVQSSVEDFTRGLKDYINTRYNNLPDQISNAGCKLWEVLEVFDDIIPRNGSKTFNVFHIAEAPGNMIITAKYFADRKRRNITNYEWRANSLNPNNTENKAKFGKYGKIFDDKYGLMKKNYNKWLWGEDGTGDITKVTNIKWFVKYINEKWIGGDGNDGNSKLDFICGDGGLNTDNEPILLQKLDLAQVLVVLSCSSIGGSCCIKHFTPYIKRHLDTYDASGFFIGFLYLYYLAFEQVNLFKPYTSNPDSGEFYLVGRGFKGVSETQLNKLYKILDNYEFNNAIIEKDKIPESFVSQIEVFLEKISNLNTIGIEKQNLLLTCYKSSLEDKRVRRRKHHSKNKYDSQSKSEKANKYLGCDTFLNETSMQDILVPRFKEWIKVYKFV